MSLEERVEKAKELTFVTIPNTPTVTVATWGSGDDFYRVKLTQPKKPYQTTNYLNHRQVALENILVECVQDGGLFDEDCDCKGNSKRTICYHVLGALMFVLDSRGQEIDFCEDEFVAHGTVERDEWDRTKNNSHFALIQSKQGRGQMWAVIRDKVKVVDHGGFEERVNSMRGNVEEEEGID